MSEVNVTPNEEDEVLLEKLLKDFNLEAALEYLKASKVTFSSLKYMENEDLKEAIPPLGLRIEFREKLFKWKKLQFGIEEETISVQSKVSYWLTEKEEFKGKKILNRSLNEILQESQCGRAILEHQHKYKKLTNPHRNSLIYIIVEEATRNKIRISVQDFSLLLNELLWIFPTEETVKDYYFIPKGSSGSPCGKLYSKYKNFRAKRSKYDSLTSSQKDFDITQETQVDEIDQSVAAAFKSSLNRESSDWNDVCEKWRKTFNIRRRDLSQLNPIEFCWAWPKLSHANAADLFEIDFDFLYPGKRQMLLSEWEVFKCKIFKYYECNIHNEFCKQQLSSAKETRNIDSQDYLITILLNSILRSSARFRNSAGKKTKKITIADSQQSFVLNLPTLNDYQRKLEEIINNYYSSGLTLQPFLIVVGNESNLNGFYVYFDNNLQIFDSFIQGLDICFKIFHVLSLKYPIASEQSWLFIQKYFFKIDTEFDLKSSDTTSLIDYLNNN